MLLGFRLDYVFLFQFLGDDFDQVFDYLFTDPRSKVFVVPVQTSSPSAFAAE
jgi:hypothetical protein